VSELTHLRAQRCRFSCRHAADLVPSPADPGFPRAVYELKKQSVGAPWTSGVEGQVVWWTNFRVLCNVIERQIRFRDTIGFCGPNFDRRSENAVYIHA
jgi:hypothetical protein